MYASHRQKHAASRKIQRVFRGYIQRKKLCDGFMCWVEVETDGNQRFFNTWTQEYASNLPEKASLCTKYIEVMINLENTQTVEKWHVQWSPQIRMLYYFNPQMLQYRWERPDSLTRESEKWFKDNCGLLKKCEQVNTKDLLLDQSKKSSVESVTNTISGVNGDSEDIKHDGNNTSKEKDSVSADKVGITNRELDSNEVIQDQNESIVDTDERKLQEAKYTSVNEFEAQDLQNSEFTTKNQSTIDYNKTIDGSNFIQIAPSNPSNPRKNIGVWVEMVDEETGYSYYVEPVTKEARWSLPPQVSLIVNNPNDQNSVDDTIDSIAHGEHEIEIVVKQKDREKDFGISWKIVPSSQKELREQVIVELFVFCHFRFNNTL